MPEDLIYKTSTSTGTEDFPIPTIVGSSEPPQQPSQQLTEIATPAIQTTDDTLISDAQKKIDQSQPLSEIGAGLEEARKLAEQIKVGLEKLGQQGTTGDKLINTLSDGTQVWQRADGSTYNLGGPGGATKPPEPEEDYQFSPTQQAYIDEQKAEIGRAPCRER